MAALTALAGCGGAEGDADLSTFLSQFAAPGALDASVLASGAFLPSNIGILTSTLLATNKYQGLHTTGWAITLYNGVSLNNLDSEPLRSSGAAFAHAAGYRGAGSTVAVSDGQYIPGISALDGANVQVVNNWGYVFAGDEPPNGHGTIVSAVIAGDASDYTGVAPDAQLIFGSYETDQKLADVGNAARAANAVAWNNSWGYPELFLNPTDFGRAFTGNQGSVNYLNALDAYAANGVVVFAVSNDNTLGHSTLMDGLPYLRPSLEAGWIAAVNAVPTLSASGDVTAVQVLSSPCYEAARWCLMADGGWQIPDTSLSLDGSTLVTGSSFAAPQISGAMAILQGAFGDLDPLALRVRLLASADDDFAGFSADDYVELATGFNKGYSVTYGHGFLDIEAALKPIGGTAMAMANGGQVSTNAPVLRSGSAFGDAVEMSLAGTDVLVRDALSGGFVMPATALTSSARPTSRVNSLLAQSLAGNMQANRMTDATALANPFTSMGLNTLRMTDGEGRATASVLVPQSGRDSMGINLTRTLTEGPTQLELGLKLARDNGQTLSLDGSNGAILASVSMGVTQDLGDTAFVALSGEIGITDLGGPSALAQSGTARFDSAAVTVGRRDVFAKGDLLTFGMALPVAVASGSTTLDLPVVRTTAAAAAFAPVALDLSPDNRQLDLEVSYQTALADGLEMKLSAVRSDNFGNREGQTDTGGAIAFTFRF
jgi:subtilase-type serine protease